jgi:hypothetical protein
LSLYPSGKKWDDAGNLQEVRHAMRYLLTALLVFVPLSSASPQTHLVNVRLRVLLVDKDLNQKPVPFQVVHFHDAANGSNSVELKTDLEGRAETSPWSSEGSDTPGIWNSKSLVQSNASTSPTTTPK